MTGRCVCDLLSEPVMDSTVRALGVPPNHAPLRECRLRLNPCPAEPVDPRTDVPQQYDSKEDPTLARSAHRVCRNTPVCALTGPAAGGWFRELLRTLAGQRSVFRNVSSFLSLRSTASVIRSSLISWILSSARMRASTEPTIPNPTIIMITQSMFVPFENGRDTSRVATSIRKRAALGDVVDGGHPGGNHSGRRLAGSGRGSPSCLPQSRPSHGLSQFGSVGPCGLSSTRTAHAAGRRPSQLVAMLPMRAHLRYPPLPRQRVWEFRRRDGTSLLPPDDHQFRNQRE